MTKKEKAIHEKAASMMARQSTKNLLIQWALTESMPMSEELPIVRGWIADELKRRDPDAYDAWLEDDDPDAQPNKYFAC